jgi:hypothetical protein
MTVSLVRRRDKKRHSDGATGQHDLWAGGARGFRDLGVCLVHFSEQPPI